MCSEVSLLEGEGGIVSVTGVQCERFDLNFIFENSRVKEQKHLGKARQWESDFF